MLENFVNCGPVNFTDFKCQFRRIVNTIFKGKSFLKYSYLFLRFSYSKDCSDKKVVGLHSYSLLVLFWDERFRLQSHRVLIIFYILGIRILVLF
jgi:hypothetical protein